jgi:hypothetical protein
VRRSQNLKRNLENLEHQIYEPTELINLLLPLITEILSRKVAEAREEVAQAIAPIIDEMIQLRLNKIKWRSVLLWHPCYPMQLPNK